MLRLLKTSYVVQFEGIGKKPYCIWYSQINLIKTYCTGLVVIILFVGKFIANQNVMISMHGPKLILPGFLLERLWTIRLDFCFHISRLTYIAGVICAPAYHGKPFYEHALLPHIITRLTTHFESAKREVIMDVCNWKLYINYKQIWQL